MESGSFFLSRFPASSLSQPSPALDGDAEFYVQELVGMAVTLDPRAAAGGGSGGSAPSSAPSPSAAAAGSGEGGGGASGSGGASPAPPPPSPLGTVVDVYSGTGPFDTLRIALHGPGLAVARAAAAAEGGAVVDEGGGGGVGSGGSGSDGSEEAEEEADAATTTTTPPTADSLSSAPSLLLPFADEFVLDVCREARTMRVAPPRGLLGLAVGGLGGGGGKKIGAGAGGKKKKGGRRGAVGGVLPGPKPHDPAWEGRKGADAHEA
jgi:hypothetical protein